jgi:hypothetical protein
MTSTSEDQGIKRRKTAHDLQRFFSATVGRRYQIDFEPDVAAESTDIHVQTQNIRANWNQTSPLNDDAMQAVMIVGLYLGLEVAWDAKNDFLMARIIALLMGEELRTHPTRAFVYKNGAWVRIHHFTGLQQQRLHFEFGKVLVSSIGLVWCR